MSWKGYIYKLFEWEVRLQKACLNNEAKLFFKERELADIGTLICVCVCVRNIKIWDQG